MWEISLLVFSSMPLVPNHWFTATLPW